MQFQHKLGQSWGSVGEGVPPTPWGGGRSQCLREISRAARRSHQLRGCGAGVGAPRVLVVCADLVQSDRIMDELTAVGLEGTPAFSADEALGLLADHRYEAVVLSEDIDEGMVGLLRWMGKRHRGVVVTLPEKREGEGEEELAERAEAGVVARLVAGLHTSK